MKEEQKGEIILYQAEDGTTKIEVRLENENVWLTQKMMAELFQTTPQNITIRLKNIFDEGELKEDATCKDFLQVQNKGSRKIERKQKFYNLVAIISVGYRIKSHIATKFRIWATERLKEYKVKGFTMDKNKTTLYIGLTNDLCRRIYEHKNHLINKKNPEWKVLVTEKGFVRETIPFSQQVNDLINELQQNEQVPSYGRNDEQFHSFRGDSGGGSAATTISPLQPKNDCHSERSEETNKIPPFSRNDNVRVNEEIPPVGRNDNASGGAGGNVGGETAHISTYSLVCDVRHSEQSEETQSKNVRHSEQSEKPQPKNDCHSEQSEKPQPKNDRHSEQSEETNTTKENNHE